MSILSPTNMGSTIDLSNYLQARANRLTTNATDIANTLKAFENARDVINRRNLFNPIKSQMEIANSYGSKQKELEDVKSWLEQNSPDASDAINVENALDTDNQVTGADIDRLSELDIAVKDGTIPKNSSLYAEWEALNNKVNNRSTQLQQNNAIVTKMNEEYAKKQKDAEDLQKWLDDNKATYENFNKNYGWINDPSFNFANEEYIRTGNSSLLSNLKNQWATQQLQKAQIEKDKANKELEETKSLQEVYDNTKIAIEGIKGEKGKKLTAEGVYTQEQKIREGIAKLERAGRKAEAEELQNLLGKKVEEGTTNDENAKKAKANKKAKLTEEWNKLSSVRKRKTPLDEYIKNGGKENE